MAGGREDSPRKEGFRPWGYVLNGTNGFGALIICFIMVLMCFDVASRNLLSKPLPGVADIVSSAIVVVVFLELPSAVRNGRLTRAELVFAPLSESYPAVARGLEVLFQLVGAALCFAIVWWSYPRLMRSWSTSEFVGIVGILTFPRWPIQAVVVAGSVLAGIQFLVNAIQVALGKRAPGDLPTAPASDTASSDEEEPKP